MLKQWTRMTSVLALLLTAPASVAAQSSQEADAVRSSRGGLQPPTEASCPVPGEDLVHAICSVGE